MVLLVLSMPLYLGIIWCIDGTDEMVREVRLIRGEMRDGGWRRWFD